MITPSFGLTATERVLPKLALDFTTASLDPRVTFTRSLNTATRVNSNGLIEVVNADLPRFDYDPVTLACKGLLIEESRSNLVIESQQIGAPWTISNVGRTVDTDISPDGTQNADTITSSANLGIHRIEQPIAASGTLTFSVFGKLKTGQKYLTIGLTRALTHYATATFDLTNGSVTQTLIAGYTGVVTAGVVQAVNGYYRAYMTATTDTITAVMVGISDTATFVNGNRGFDSYFGSVSDSIVVWGAQLEAGAFPTSYIPTTTTALTRNADVATMTGTNFSDWYSNEAGTFMCQAIPSVASSPATRQMMTVGTIPPLYVNQNSTTVRSNDGTSVVVASGVIAANTSFKCAVSYDVNGRSISKDAGTPVTGTYDGSFGTTSFNIGANGSAFFWNGYIQKINWYQQKLTNAEVQAITK